MVSEAGERETCAKKEGDITMRSMFMKQLNEDCIFYVGIIRTTAGDTHVVGFASSINLHGDSRIDEQGPLFAAMFDMFGVHFDDCAFEETRIVKCSNEAEQDRLIQGLVDDAERRGIHVSVPPRHKFVSPKMICSSVSYS